MHAMRDESLSKSVCKGCVFIQSRFSPGFYASSITNQISTCVVSVVHFASSIVLSHQPVDHTETSLEMARTHLNSVPSYRLRSEDVENWRRKNFGDNGIHVEVS